MLSQNISVLILLYLLHRIQNSGPKSKRCQRQGEVNGELLHHAWVVFWDDKNVLELKW